MAASSRWSRTKDAVRDDTRYAAVPREEREALFRQYTGELQVGLLNRGSEDGWGTGWGCVAAGCAGG